MPMQMQVFLTGFILGLFTTTLAVGQGQNFTELCDPDLWEEISSGEEVEQLAEEFGQEEMLSLRCGADRNTCLHLAAWKNQYPEVIDALIDMGFYVEDENEQNQNAIHLAMMNENNKKTLPILLEEYGGIVADPTQFSHDISSSEEKQEDGNSNNEGERRGAYISVAGGGSESFFAHMIGMNYDTFCYPTSSCFIQDPRPEINGYTWEYDIETNRGSSFEVAVGLFEGRGFLDNIRAELAWARQISEIGRYDFTNGGYLNSDVPRVRDHETTIQSNSKSAIDSITTHTVSVNLYHDIPNRTRLTPYGGYGLGLATAFISNSHYSNSYMDTADDPKTVYDPPLSFYNGSKTTNPSDTFIPFVQVHVGADWRLNEQTSIGAKLTYALFDEIDYVEQYDRHPMHSINPDFSFHESWGKTNRWRWMVAMKSIWSR